MTEKLAALKAGEYLEFFGLDKPKCPHCGDELDISESGSYQLYEEGDHEITCEACDLDYTVSTRVSYTFSTDSQEETP